MDALGMLEQLFLSGEITEEEYTERKDIYIETLLDLYINGIISKEELYERLNQ